MSNFKNFKSIIFQEIYYYNHKCDLALILFTNFIQMLSLNNTSFDFPLFYN